MMNPEEITKNTLITNLIKEMPIEQIIIPPENKKNIKKFVNYLLVKDYLLLDNDNIVLGLSSESTAEPSLSYTERKAIKEYIETTLTKVFQPVIRNIKEKEADGYDSNANDQRVQMFLENQKELQSKQLQLLSMKKEKLELMLQVAKIRVGPDQRQEIENLYNETKMNNLKIEVLEKIIRDKFLKSTAHTTKALKTVENYIDSILPKEKKNESG